MIEKRQVGDKVQGFLKVPGGEDVLVDIDSLGETDAIVRRLDWETIRKLGAFYDVRVGPGQPPSALRLIVRSHVQNDWYITVKGDIPMAVQEKHQERKGQVEKTAAASGAQAGQDGTAPAAPRQRAPKVPSKWAQATDMTETKKTEMAKVRGQAQRVLTALGKATAPVTPAELATLILADGPYPAKHDDVAGSALYHLKSLKQKGFVVEFEQLAAQPAAA